jgi:hypothetical protein
MPSENENLINAIENVDLERTRLALDRGANPNLGAWPYSNDWLPVFHAIDSLNEARLNDYPYSLDLLRLLLEANADLGISWKDKTPLEMATGMGFAEAVEVLRVAMDSRRSSIEEGEF